MATALDADPSKLDEQETNFVNRIREHGWTATHVLEDDEGPSFSYSTGFWHRFQQPEVILFSIPHDVANDFFGYFSTK